MMGVNYEKIISFSDRISLLRIAARYINKRFIYSVSTYKVSSLYKILTRLFDKWRVFQIITAIYRLRSAYGILFDKVPNASASHKIDDFAVKHTQAASCRGGVNTAFSGVDSDKCLRYF